MILFVVELFGRIGPGGLQFLDEIGKNSYEWRNSMHRFRSYWLRRFSCAMVQNLGLSYRRSLDLYLGNRGEGLKSANLYEQFWEVNYSRGVGVKKSRGSRTR